MAAEECGLDSRNWALGVAEQDVGVEAVLLRARRSYGAGVGCPRRQGGYGRRKLGVVVARAREARKGGEQEWGRQGVTRGREIQQEVALGGLHRRSAAEAERSRRGKRWCQR
jgi:hypothetical protein